MKEKKCNIKLYWTTNIWPKWQLVIPKEIRDKLELNTGDSMSIILKDDKFIWILRNKDVSELMEYIENENK